MIKKIIILIVSIVIILGVILVLIDYRTNTIYFEMYGDNPDFDARIISDGSVTTYMWNRRMKVNIYGSTDLDVFYIGDKNYDPDTVVTTETNRLTYFRGKSYHPNWNTPIDPHIISSSTGNLMIHPIEKFSLTVYIGDDEYVINFSER